MDTREAYFKYLESILIKHDELIEPTASEIDFQATSDINGRIIFYSPLLGERYRLWKYYSYSQPTAKFGHAVVSRYHSYDFGVDSFLVNIRTGERHKLDHNYHHIIGKDKMLVESGSNLFVEDFKGNIKETLEEKPQENPEKRPRREGIKGVVEDGFFKTKYVYGDLVLDIKPILDYDGNIICYQDEQIYLYDKTHDTYTRLCHVDEFDYTYNGIIINDKRYMLFKGKLIDVTGYPNIDDYILSNELINVLDFAEFKLLYETSPEYESEREKARLDRQRVLAIIEDQRRLKELEENAKHREERKEELKQGIEETQRAMFELYQKYLDQINEYESLGDDNPFAHKKIVPISADILFVEVDGHKEINPFFLDNHLLRYADLSVIDFSNVKLDHVSCLAYTNANIDPQTVFNKDLSFSDLRGIYHTRDNFDGVNMEGTIVDEDKLDFATNLSNQTIINDHRADSFMDTEEALSSLTDDLDK